MATLVCFLEERSAKAMLNIILPKLLPSRVSFQCIAFEGKADLRKNFAKKLKKHLAPDSVFLIMCDQDAMECRQLKQELQKKIPQDKRAKVRIACRELESFYLGDLEAVEQGLNVSGIAK